jgi:hypothetical protein
LTDRKHLTADYETVASWFRGRRLPGLRRWGYRVVLDDDDGGGLGKRSALFARPFAVELGQSRSWAVTASNCGPYGDGIHRHRISSITDAPDRSRPSEFPADVQRSCALTDESMNAVNSGTPSDQALAKPAGQRRQAGYIGLCVIDGQAVNSHVVVTLSSIWRYLAHPVTSR